MSKSRPQPWITAKNQRAANGQTPTVVEGKPVGKIKWAGVVRWLHLYLSVLSFVLVLFFAVTGLTLNHPDWFADAERTTEQKGKINPAWVSGTDTLSVNKLAIVEYFRAKHGLKGSVSEFRMDEQECTVSFRGPGYSADVFIDRPAGNFELTETHLGLVAVMNDLHKGRDTSQGWAWVIDISAVFMTLVSVTGLLLLLFLKKRRVNGLWWLVIGGILSWLAYWYLVT